MLLIIIILMFSGCIVCPDQNICGHDIAQIGMVLGGSGAILYYIKTQIGIIINKIKHMCNINNCNDCKDK